MRDIILATVRCLIILRLGIAPLIGEALGASAQTPLPASEPGCSRTEALGTSRILDVGSEGGLHVGLKTYPQTLALGEKEVVLTFDDGPVAGPTSRVLDALKAECVKATFFLIGRNAAAAPALVRREIAEGHTVGHHSWSHPARTLRGLSYTAAIAEIRQGIDAVEMAGYGVKTDRPHVPFFRFPGFADTPELRSFLDANTIAVLGADLWASDWSAQTPEAELDLVMRRLDAAHGGIVLFHDTRPQTVTMLPTFLRALKARGYRIVHLVPRAGAGAPVRQAPPGWTSETERSLATILPTSPAAARRRPASGLDDAAAREAIAVPE